MLALLSNIVDYAVLEENDVDLAMVTGATFKLDFGPWKRGQVCELIQIAVTPDNLVWMEEFCAALCVNKVQVGLTTLVI